jgi:hypothetical protein
LKNRTTCETITTNQSKNVCCEIFRRKGRKQMRHYQDTETGRIFAFEDDVDPWTLNNRNIPTTLSEIIKPKPDDSHVWYQDGWIMQKEAPSGYTQPVSSVPSYNPAWMTYLHPYTAVHHDQNSGLNISLDEINENSYDGKKLAEVVTSLPLSTPSGLPALISYDGAIAIPQCGDFPSAADGVIRLNEILCSLLLGGVHVEVLHSAALTIGTVQDEVRLFAFAPFPSLHSQLRLNQAPTDQRLLPLTSPRVLMVADIQAAYSQGQQLVGTVRKLSPFFLLNGYTAMMYRNNSDALNNLWIAVEQLTEHLWVEKYEKEKGTYPAAVAKHHARLKKNPGLDKISAKHKLLQHSQIISAQCLKTLDKARKQRNDLAHKGIVPDLRVVEMLWVALPDLLEEASGIRPLGMRNLNGGGEHNWAIPPRTNLDEWRELATRM